MFVACSRGHSKPRRPEGRIDWFKELSARCDATLLIAPETDDVLGGLCQRIEVGGKRLLSSSSAAVRTCADKLEFASLLERSGVETIPTHPLSWEIESPLAISQGVVHFPFVVKPRDGAGSQCTRLIRCWCDFDNLRKSLSAQERNREFVWQLFIPGKPVSVALMIPESGGETEVFPVAEQSLSDDGRFFYKGGRIPAREVDQTSIQAAALGACRCVPGLRGYVGVDLIVPAGEPSRPIVVEINPRLTTSYLGYRALAIDNLAGRMLPGRTNIPIEWRSGEVEFDAAGNVKA
jgi:predicted ATP-grasp superfamily ATP-dependent carboligase